jgi:para-nitrobenzyl esterase
MAKRVVVMVLFCVGTAAVAMGADADIVHTTSGLVSGISGSTPGMRVFKGIPYATPPLGELRWRPPQPPRSWEGIHKAEAFGPECMQSPNAMGGPFRDLRQKREPISEDCLYLNIWTPASSPEKRLPVMVWIYGGGFKGGSSSLPYYDGEALAKKGVVVVSFNYRVGVFGFLAHPDLIAESPHHAAGDYGLLDMVGALGWVRDNIAAFGGDPQRVTIFGESAGSLAVSYLMASPLAKGLFQRVIGESGAGVEGSLSPWPLAKTEHEGIKFAQSAGAKSIAELRAMPADQLYSACEAFVKVNGGWRSSYWPDVDGWFLPDSPYHLFAAGKQNDVPLLTGTNADEGSFFLQPVSAEKFIEQANSRFGDQAPEYLKLYPVDSAQKVLPSEIASETDDMFAAAARTWVDLQSRTGKSQAYLYFLSRVPPMPDAPRYGAFHGADLFYVFGAMNYHPDWAWTPIDSRLSETMISYWVNFATRDDPNGKGLPRWPVYSEKTHLVIQLGDRVEAVHLPHQARLDFWDEFFAKERRGIN